TIGNKKVRKACCKSLKWIFFKRYRLIQNPAPLFGLVIAAMEPLNKQQNDYRVIDMNSSKPESIKEHVIETLKSKKFTRNQLIAQIIDLYHLRCRLMVFRRWSS